MPGIPVEFLRGVLGVLCVFFAHMAGRAAMAVRTGRGPLSRMYAWILRTSVCGVVLIFRHDVDRIALVVWALAAASFALGMWTVARPKPPQDLSSQIFP